MIEGALTAAQAADARSCFMLGILDDHQIKNPEEIEPGFPTWFEAPRFAKAAGLAFLERHPQAVGYDVSKVFDGGHYRTVETYWKEA